MLCTMQLHLLRGRRQYSVSNRKRSGYYFKISKLRVCQWKRGCYNQKENAHKNVFVSISIIISSGEFFRNEYSEDWKLKWEKNYIIAAEDESGKEEISESMTRICRQTNGRYFGWPEYIGGGFNWGRLYTSGFWRRDPLCGRGYFIRGQRRNPGGMGLA